MNKFTLVLILFTGLMFTACHGSGNQSNADTLDLSTYGANSNSNMLLCAGITFNHPLLSKLFGQYNSETHVMVTYQSIGRDRSISQLIKKRVDFALTDGLPSDGQTKEMPAPILKIPMWGIPATGKAVSDANNRLVWALIYKEQNYDGRSLQRVQKVLKLLWWTVHEGQKYCKEFSYSPLPPAITAEAESALISATFDGKPVL